MAARLGDAISLYDGDAVVGANLALDRSRVDGEVRFAVRVPNGAIFTSVCINPGPDGGPRGWVFSQSSSASVPAAWITNNGSGITPAAMGWRQRALTTSHPILDGARANEACNWR